MNMVKKLVCGVISAAVALGAASAFATWTVLSDADFVSVANGNWHQRRYSNLIDSGTVDTAYRPADSSAIDLDGNERISGNSIDLGCWEVLTGTGSVYILR